jgi:hypothetical protein
MNSAEKGLPDWRPLYWSVRRELWENRSIYVAPLAVAAVFLVGFFIGLIRFPERMRAAAALGPMQRQEAIEQPYVFAAIMLMAIALIVAVVYCLDALYGERRDRSILFWKSLPVSDLTSVLSKASIPILVLPLVTFLVTVATQFIMLLVSSVVLAGAGMSATTLWIHVPFFEVSATNFLHVAAAGVGLGKTCAFALGHPASRRDRCRREDRFQHLAFRRDAAVSIHGQHGIRPPRRQDYDGHAGTPSPRAIPDQPWAVGRPRHHRSIPVRGDLAAPLSRTDLINAHDSSVVVTQSYPRPTVGSLNQREPGQSRSTPAEARPSARTIR